MHPEDLYQYFQMFIFYSGVAAEAKFAAQLIQLVVLSRRVFDTKSANGLTERLGDWPNHSTVSLLEKVHVRVLTSHQHQFIVALVFT